MKKLVKISRYLRARYAPATARPFFWHIGRPNFGDDINPMFFQALVNQRIRFEHDRQRPHFLGMGSILDRATASSTVLGSGYIEPPSQVVQRPRKVIAVRGELTRAFLQNDDEILLGDPMVLLGGIIPVDKNRDELIGFIPHVSALRQVKRMAIPNVKIIDPSWPPMRVISEIASCTRVFSQSLHGLIVADTLRIPNIWIAPSVAMKGGDFKFRDYFSTLDAIKVPWEFTLESFAAAKRSDFYAAQYRFDASIYREAVREALA